MGAIGNGYGSECHLLRWMGRHRHAFDRTITSLIRKPQSSITWLDMQFDGAKEAWQDRELKGLEFLENNLPLQNAWREYWPTGSGIMNWDAVGWIIDGDVPELLLVEAKAHVIELRSRSHAKDTRSVATIGKAFVRTKEWLGVAMDRDWLNGYYQLANRLATLSFLHQHGIKAHLLNIYFTGDKRDDCDCPQTAQEWESAISTQSSHIGLPSEHPLVNYLHKVFLPVIAAC